MVNKLMKPKKDKGVRKERMKKIMHEIGKASKLAFAGLLTAGVFSCAGSSGTPTIIINEGVKDVQEMPKFEFPMSEDVGQKDGDVQKDVQKEIGHRDIYDPEDVQPKYEDVGPKSEDIQPNYEDVLPGGEDVIPGGEDVQPKYDDVGPTSEDIVVPRDEGITNRDEGTSYVDETTNYADEGTTTTDDSYELVFPKDVQTDEGTEEQDVSNDTYDMNIYDTYETSGDEGNIYDMYEVNDTYDTYDTSGDEGTQIQDLGQEDVSQPLNYTVTQINATDASTVFLPTGGVRPWSDPDTGHVEGKTELVYLGTVVTTKAITFTGISVDTGEMKTINLDAGANIVNEAFALYVGRTDNKLGFTIYTRCFNSPDEDAYLWNTGFPDMNPITYLEGFKVTGDSVDYNYWEPVQVSNTDMPKDKLTDKNMKTGYSKYIRYNADSTLNWTNSFDWTSDVSGRLLVVVGTSPEFGSSLGIDLNLQKLNASLEITNNESTVLSETVNTSSEHVSCGRGQVLFPQFRDVHPRVNSGNGAYYFSVSMKSFQAGSNLETKILEVGIVKDIPQKQLTKWQRIIREIKQQSSNEKPKKKNLLSRLKSLVKRS